MHLDVEAVHGSTCAHCRGGFHNERKIHNLSLIATGTIVARAVVFCGTGVVIAGIFRHAASNLCIVADAVGVGVGLTRTAAFAEGVQLVPVAVAIAFRDVRTATLENVAWPVANATNINHSNARVNVVADSVCVCIGLTETTTLAQRVELVAIAIAIAFRNICTAALINGSFTSTNVAFVQGQA